MNKRQPLRLPDDWRFLAAWFVMFAGTIGLAGVLMQNGNQVLFFFEMMVGVLGLAGVYHAIRVKSTGLSNALVATSLFACAPYTYFCIIPLPILFGFDRWIAYVRHYFYARGDRRMAMSGYAVFHTMAGVLLVLTVFAIVAWHVAKRGNRIARQWHQTLQSAPGWLIPVAVYLLVLLVYQVICLLVLVLACMVGLYSDLSLGWGHFMR